MKRHDIPTAEHMSFQDFDSASAYIQICRHEIVIKASGLAASKGVLMPTSKEEALEAVEDMMLKRSFGAAGEEEVIEEYLEGFELSILTFGDGVTFKSLPPAQEHKRMLENDKGTNTGGMGCYAPAKMATPALLKEVDETILKPTFDGMRKEGTAFPTRRCTYRGLIS